MYLTMTQLLDGNVSDETKAVAVKELNETADARESAIRTLRALLESEKHLRSRTDQAFLLRFLRARKYDVHKAFKLVKNYYYYRYKYTEVFDNLVPSQVRKNLLYNYQSLLPRRDRQGRAVMVVRSGAWNPDEYGPDEMFRTNCMCMEQAVLDPETQVRGLVMINDLKGMGLHHLRKCPPSHFVKVIHLVQDGFPARFKALHIVNEPFFIRAFLSLLLPFVKEKFRKRIYFHGEDMSSLHQHISPDVLPKEYGGTQGDFDNRDFVAAMEENEELFKRDGDYGYSELSD